MEMIAVRTLYEATGSIIDHQQSWQPHKATGLVVDQQQSRQLCEATESVLNGSCAQNVTEWLEMVHHAQCNQNTSVGVAEDQLHQWAINPFLALARDIDRSYNWSNLAHQPWFQLNTLCIGYGQERPWTNVPRPHGVPPVVGGQGDYMSPNLDNNHCCDSGNKALLFDKMRCHVFQGMGSLHLTRILCHRCQPKGFLEWMHLC